MNYRKTLMVALLGLALAIGVAGCDDDPSEIEETVEESGEEATSEEEEEDGEESSAEETSEEDEEEGEESESEEESEEEEEDDEAEAEDDGEEGEGEEQAEAQGQEIDPSDLPIYATGTVATIGGESITADDFNAIVELQLGALPAEAIEAQRQQLPQMKEMLVEGLVAAYLVDQEIERQGIEISDEEVDEAVEQYLTAMAQQMGGDRQQLEAMMGEQGIEREMIREQAAQEMAAERLLAERGDGPVTEEQARSYYEQNRAQFQQQHATQVRHILLNVDDHEEGQSNEDEMLEKAEGLRAELVSDGDRFPALAAEHSDCPSSQQGGELGYITEDQLMPEFTEVAFQLEIGAISEPVRSNLGWHIIRAEDRVEEATMSFDEVKEDLMAMLEAQGMEQTAMELVEELREQADIEIHDGAVHISG